MSRWKNTVFSCNNTFTAKKEGQGVTVNRALPSTFMTASALEAEILVQHCDGALDVRLKTFTGFANGRRALSLPLAGRKDIPAFFPSWQVGFYAIGRSDVGAGDYAVFSKLRITAAP